MAEKEGRSIPHIIDGIHPGLSTYQFKCLKLACKPLGISSHKLENGCESFSNLYELLAEKVPQEKEVLTLVYHMLFLVGFKKPLMKSLRSLVADDFSFTKYSEVDLVLTISVVLSKMNHRCYRRLIKIIQPAHFPEYHKSHFDDRFRLLDLLVDRSILKPYKLPYFYKWFDECNCTEFHENLNNYCERQRMQIPTDWHDLVLAAEPEHENGDLCVLN